MNREKRFFVTFFLTVLVLSFIGRASVSASPGEVTDWNPVADVMVGPGGINFIPKVNFARLLVSVARADGSVFQGTFFSGSTPYVDLSSIMGNTYLDGTYTYELRVIPNNSMKIRKEPEAGGLEKDEILPQKALTQSGSFRVQGGAIMTGGAEELDRTMDIIHPDDVIITGGLCVGDDCSDGESFGYCTIKLKENNLQMCFEDTSIGTFPTNDWKIQINDTTSGGASYFTIWDTDGGRRPFTIEAGAPSHSLYVEDYGRVGLGTSVPSVELHIVDGDTPTIRLDQDGSSGWTPQIWDLAGNETNFFIRDATNGSRLCFRIQPNTPTNTLCMRSTGNVGIGTWSPEYRLELETTGTAATFVADQTDGATALVSAETNYVFIGSKSNNDFRLVVGDSPKMTLMTNGYVGIGITNPTHLLHLSGGAYSDGTTWRNASSIEYKENIQDITTNEALDALNGLKPVKFNYKVDKNEECLGFIAEEVPELVAVNDRKGLCAMDVVAVLTKVLQEQQKTIAELKKKIAGLKKK
jgi:hypothetical protein